MCCCTVPTCCCGCTSMRTGLLIYAILDALVQILFGVLLVLLKIPFLGAAAFIMAIIDFILAIGIQIRNQCLLLLWMIFAMLYIIGGFISALLLTAASGLLKAAETIGNALCNAQENGNNLNISNCDELSNIHTNEGLWILAKIIAWTFPGVVIYFWVVVRSHRVEMLQVQNNPNNVSVFATRSSEKMNEEYPA